MPGNIKGITIEIDGDTTGLSKALKGVDTSLKQTQSGLKEVNKLLKLDPTSTTLLQQKQKLLASAVKDTSDKLNTLKTAQEQAKAQLANGDIGQDKYDALTREIVKTEAELKNLAIEAGKSNTAVVKLSEASKDLKKLGGSLQDVGGKLTAGVTAPIAGIGTAAVAAASTFDSALSQVQATMGITADHMSTLNGESVNTMDAMRDLAKEMGSSTAWSAKECADAINFLSLAGYDTQQIYETLPTVLNLASAGGMELATASDMVTDAMSALGLETEDAEVMVDQMAKTASSSNTSVAQLGDALLTIGATGRSVAGGTTELNTALGILANNGIKGSEGGTKLRNVIMSLQSPTQKASDEMEKLGLSVYDAEGNMRPMNDILEDFNLATATMTSEERSNVISKIFNKADIAAVNALLAGTDGQMSGVTEALNNCGVEWEKYSDNVWAADGVIAGVMDDITYNVQRGMFDSKEGMEEMVDYLSSEYDIAFEDAKLMVEALAQGVDDSTSAWDKLSGAIEDSSGSAQQMADTQLDNLEGKLTLLKSALEGAAISIGEKLMPYIDKVVESIQKAVDWFNSLDESQLQLIVTIAAVVAAIGPVIAIIGTVISTIGGILGAISSVAAAWTTLSTLLSAGTPIITALCTTFGALNVGFVAIIAVIAAVIAIGVALYKNWDKIKETASKFVAHVKKCWSDFVKDTSAKFNQVKTAISNAWSNIKQSFSNAITAIKTAFSNGMNVLKTTATNVMTSVKTALTNGIQNAVTAVSQKLSTLKDKFTNAFNSIKSTVSNAISKVKSLLSGSISFPKIKLPHFSVTGKAPFGLGGLGEKPSISVSWYAKAMNQARVLDGPTVFGMDGSNLLAGGEKGREIVSGEAHLLDMISSVVDSRIGNMGQHMSNMENLMAKYLPEIAAGGDWYLDGDKWVGCTATRMNDAIGAINMAKKRRGG